MKRALWAAAATLNVLMAFTTQTLADGECHGTIPIIKFPDGKYTVHVYYAMSGKYANFDCIYPTNCPYPPCPFEGDQPNFDDLLKGLFHRKT